MTIGLERPRPGRLALHATLGSFGIDASIEAPEEAGPRKCGQSEARSPGENACISGSDEIVSTRESRLEGAAELMKKRERIAGEAVGKMDLRRRTSGWRLDLVSRGVWRCRRYRKPGAGTPTRRSTTRSAHSDNTSPKSRSGPCADDT